jgi:nucleoside phosphorylase
MHNTGIYVGGNLTVNEGSVRNTVQAGGRTSPRAGVDVLIITALRDEYDAAHAAAGATEWQDHGVGGPTPYSATRYRTATGQTISVALARPTQMGGRSTSPIATKLTEQLKPACLAMSGVCAGHPGETAPGDVIIAAPAYEWDEGKHTGGAFHADPQQFPQDTRWTRTAQEFDPSALPSHGVATDEEAEVWYLERLHKDQNPRKHPARDRYFPGAKWRTGLQRMNAAGLIAWQDARWALTDAGRDRIERTLYEDVDGPDRLPFKVYTGPMASGSAVMTDPEIWGRLEVGQRKILALEMEAATIATVAHHLEVPHWLVAKGVMDHANFEKDDRFKAFAARASAEVLFALLPRLLRPAATSPAPTASAERIPGPVKLEIVRRLTYDWQDLADVVGAPSHDTRRFRAGDEPRELWGWLESRGRLSDLPGALAEIGRDDLAGLLHPYR